MLCLPCLLCACRKCSSPPRFVATLDLEPLLSMAPTMGTPWAAVGLAVRRAELARAELDTGPRPSASASRGPCTAGWPAVSRPRRRTRVDAVQRKASCGGAACGPLSEGKVGAPREERRLDVASQCGGRAAPGAT